MNPNNEALQLRQALSDRLEAVLGVKPPETLIDNLEAMARMGMPLDEVIPQIQRSVAMSGSPAVITIGAGHDLSEMAKTLAEMEANAAAKKAKDVGRVPFYDYNNPRRRNRK